MNPAGKQRPGKEQSQHGQHRSGAPQIAQLNQQGRGLWFYNDPGIDQTDECDKQPDAD